MSQSTTTKTKVEPSANRSAAPTGVGHELELCGIVRIEEAERHGVDEPVGH